MTVERSDLEKFLVAKMVDRVNQLKRENLVFERKLEEPALSDKDYDLYQGLMDRNIGEQMAYRRMEDNLREWRTDHAPQPARAYEKLCPCGSGQALGRCDA